jgi:Fe-S oxidoreductase
VLIQGHCHQQALMKTTGEEALFRHMGSDVNRLDSGCCGMAGAFGFERDKFEISQAIGERVLLPAVRRQARETLIVADGFSCREQIHQNTGRIALHLAEVLSLAIDQKTSVTESEGAK